MIRETQNARRSNQANAEHNESIKEATRIMLKGDRTGNGGSRHGRGDCVDQDLTRSVVPDYRKTPHPRDETYHEMQIGKSSRQIKRPRWVNDWQIAEQGACESPVGARDVYLERAGAMAESFQCHGHNTHRE